MIKPSGVATGSRDGLSLIHVTVCQHAANGHGSEGCGSAARKRFFLTGAPGGAGGNDFQVVEHARSYGKNTVALRCHR